MNTAARVIEVAIGLGIHPVAGCNLCEGREEACPTHAGVAIAAELDRAGFLA